MSLCCFRLVQSAVAAALGIDGSLILGTPDHLKALGTLLAPAGPIHPFLDRDYCILPYQKITFKI